MRDGAATPCSQVSLNATDGSPCVLRLAGMRKTCLMVLSHLILNDMMKVKGHIARLALCLRDGDKRIAGLAQVFFHELSRKAFKVCSTVLAFVASHDSF